MPVKQSHDALDSDKVGDPLDAEPAGVALLDKYWWRAAFVMVSVDGALRALGTRLVPTSGWGIALPEALSVALFAFIAARRGKRDRSRHALGYAIGAALLLLLIGWTKTLLFPEP